MIQTLNTEHITCPICLEEHDSQVMAFPKTLLYNNQKLSSAEFYHTCPTLKIFLQTNRDINETFKLEKQLKKQYDIQLATQAQGFNPNVQQVNMVWNGNEWTRI